MIISRNNINASIKLLLAVEVSLFSISEKFRIFVNSSEGYQVLNYIIYNIKFTC